VPVLFKLAIKYLPNDGRAKKTITEHCNEKAIVLFVLNIPFLPQAKRSCSDAPELSFNDCRHLSATNPDHEICSEHRSFSAMGRDLH
jgi:hypothetical protein